MNNFLKIFSKILNIQSSHREDEETIKASDTAKDLKNLSCTTENKNTHKIQSSSKLVVLSETNTYGTPEKEKLNLSESPISGEEIYYISLITFLFICGIKVIYDVLSFLY